jgi:hypothetical protein
MENWEMLEKLKFKGHQEEKRKQSAFAVTTNA